MTPPTPYLSVDVDRLHRNIEQAAATAREAGVALRPHAKTHKSPPIAALQLAAGGAGLTVATIGEAEVFAEHGADDLLIGLPLWLDEERAARLAAIAERAVIGIGVDSVEAGVRAATLLAGAPAGRIHALVEVDSGHHRSGVDPGDAGEVAEQVAAAGLEVRGVFTFPGHSYAPDARRSAARQETEALLGSAEALRSRGLDVEVISGGSTPSLEYSDFDRLTETRPGVYVFGDAQQWELGVIGPEQIALTCRATVISRRPGRYVLDAGSKALGADRAPWATGFGRVLHDPDARVVLLSEHHAVVETPGATPGLGEVVDLVPNHACNAVNLADRLYLSRTVDGDRWWPVAARGLNW